MWANANWLYPCGEAGFVVGFYEYTAEGGLITADREPPAAQAGSETAQGFFFVHTDYARIITAHAGVGLVSRTARKNSGVRTGHMLMRADHQTC